MPYADDYLKLTLPNISIQHCRCVYRTDDVEKHNRANRSIYIVKFIQTWNVWFVICQLTIKLVFSVARS